MARTKKMTTKAQWQFPTTAAAEYTAAFPNLPPIIAQLLWNRGLRSAPAATQFLQPNYERDVHDPFLFRDMEKAVLRLAAAIAAQEKIFVHGDYDADGICAATILTSVLKLLGADVEGFIPHRELDGYGVRTETVELLAQRGAKIIITCDCGISNAPEIARAAELGIDVIVTDHHTIPETLPAAYAILHPKVSGETYPDKGLSGGGVAFKFMQGLLRHPITSKLAPPELNLDGWQKWQLDLVAISSVADMVPLIGETRTLVHYGCLVLQKTRRPGLRALLQSATSTASRGANQAGSKSGGLPRVTPQTIGFKISPRLNAAGRMDHGKTAFELLMTTDALEAEKLVSELNQHNSNRQKLVETIVKEARARIQRDQLHQHPALIIAGANWPAGVLGLIASRLKDEFYKPTFVIGINGGENGTEPRVVGSGRSIDEWNMIAAMQQQPELFSKFGGHPQACGFSLANAAAIEPFACAMNELAQNQVAEIRTLIRTINVDACLPLHELDHTLIEYLARFEPFGIGNPEPTFLSEQMRVVSLQPVGVEGKHLRLMVNNGSPQVKKMMAFGLGEQLTNFSPGTLFDGVYTLSINEWNGTRELEYKLNDFKIAE